MVDSSIWQRPWRRIHLGSIVIAMALLMISGCSSSDENDYVERSVEAIYEDAMAAFDKKSYHKAAKLFDEMERQHPYSVWATKAQLMAAYARYLDNDYDEAISTLDRFTINHPGSSEIAYAYYLKALCYYERIADVDRDQKMTFDALTTLNEVVRRFPDTEYARDARLKRDMTNDHLAGKEMAVGRFYQKKGQYLSAINRYRQVIKTYETTSHVPEALHRLVESYMALGILNEARAAASVLGHNYPGSQWYEDSYSLLVEEAVIDPNDDSSNIIALGE